MFSLLFALWVGAVVLSLGFFLNFFSLFSYSAVKDHVYETAYYPEVKAVYELAKGVITSGNFSDLGQGKFSLVIGNSTWVVEWKDVGSRLNPNALKEEDWRQLLENCGLQEGEEMSIILDSLMDWTDKDDRRRLNGAEKEYYQNLPLPYEPRNGPFLSTEELIYVRGITHELYRCLSSVLSIYGKGKIDINTADRETLINLGFTKEDVERILEKRKEERIKSLDELSSIVSVPEEAVKWLSFSPSKVYEVTLWNAEIPVKVKFVWDAEKNKTLRFY